jgi:Ca2+-binding RTX toxin-like protein
MARFSLLEQLLRSDSGFADFLASLTGGSSGHDHLNGTTGGNFLFAGASADAVAGMAGNDMLNGGSGDDKVWGSLAMTISPAAPATTFGRRLRRPMDSGNGNDTLLSRPTPARWWRQDGRRDIFAARPPPPTARTTR